MFENLLPDPHNRTILNLLFDLATWHAYAKLRLHTSDTLSFFDTATLTLANSVRQFVKVTCNAFDTRELPQETTTRGRRKPAFAGSSSGQASASHSTTKRKVLNLQTYKYHALGDYPNAIRRFGTTDNYSTQTVSLYSVGHKYSDHHFSGGVTAPTCEETIPTDIKDKGNNGGLDDSP